jgi:hypothetical protein
MNDDLDGRKLYKIYEEENDAQSIGVDSWDDLLPEDQRIWECIANRLKGL